MYIRRKSARLNSPKLAFEISKSDTANSSKQTINSNPALSTRKTRKNKNLTPQISMKKTTPTRLKRLKPNTCAAKTRKLSQPKPTKSTKSTKITTKNVRVEKRTIDEEGTSSQIAESSNQNSRELETSNNVSMSPLSTSTQTLTLTPQQQVQLDFFNSPTMQAWRSQLKKARIKFDKACHQLTILDQHMSDLQNSYSNSLDNDRKMFKILYRMQLATYEGTHNAYIEYIERQVEKIKRLKRLLFIDTSSNEQPSDN